MIEIILTIVAFTFIGYILTTIVGYFYIGWSAVFIIVASLTIGAFVLMAAFTISAAILRGVTAGVSGIDYDPEKERVRFPGEPAPGTSADDRYTYVQQREKELYGETIPTGSIRRIPKQLPAGEEDRRPIKRLPRGRVRGLLK